MENENLDPNEAKGIIGRSPLLDLEYFHFVCDIPAEYLHSSCLGVVKRLVQLTFHVGVTRPRVTKRKLTPVNVFNVAMSSIKVPRESGRRIRYLDFSVYKRQEFRNIILFFFVIVVECIEETAQEERKIWLLLAYIMRACVIPTPEFQQVNLQDIDYFSKVFYKLYKKNYGVWNCTYNTHIVGSHILQVREHGPLTVTSAFGFENFYGELRQSFTPGTCSPLKQIMSKVYLKRKLEKHTCQASIVYTNHETALECNNLIYTFRNRQYNCYKIVDIDENQSTFNCVKIETTDVFFPETPTIDWGKVGVFELFRVTDETAKIEAKLVAGKLIKVKNFVMTCPENVLNEK